MSRNLIAILRGLHPHAATDIAGALIDAGIDKIEVPLNSPDAFVSIERIVRAYGENALVGAGTVLETGSVARLADIGAKLVVSPNCCPAVISDARGRGMTCYPGVLSPTECFSAIEAGANGLKLFPAAVLGPGGLSALKAVLPPNVPLFAVGGVSEPEFGEWLRLGIDGFGLGGSLFQPDMSVAEVSRRALSCVKTYDSWQKRNSS